MAAGQYSRFTRPDLSSTSGIDTIATGYFFGSAGSTAYTLTGLSGSYSATGTSATLTKTSGSIAYTLTGLAGSYAETGTSATVKVNRKLTGLAGSYAETGTTATLKVNRKITGLTGSYSLTGSTATLTKATGAIAYTLTGLSGSYAQAGTSASLKVAKQITGLAGSYSVTGQTATLTKSSGPVAYTLIGLSGSYGVQGSNAVLAWSGGVPSYSNSIDLEKRWYVRRGKKLHIFANAQDADAFIEAEEEAQKAVEKAQKSSRLARKRLREKLFKPSGSLLEKTIDFDWVAHLVSLYSIPVDLPALIAQQDYERVVQIMLLAQEMQDEEEIEMLLLSY